MWDALSAICLFSNEWLDSRPEFLAIGLGAALFALFSLKGLKKFRKYAWIYGFFVIFIDLMLRSAQFAVYKRQQRVEDRAEKVASELQAGMMVSEAEKTLLMYASKLAIPGNPILFYSFNDYPGLNRYTAAPQIRLYTDGRDRVVKVGYSWTKRETLP